VKFQRSTKYIEIPFLIVITFIFFLLTRDGLISNFDSIVLLALFLGFIVYTIIYAKKHNNENNLEEVLEEKGISVIKSIFQILIGIIALKLGGEFVVDNSTEIAKIIGISDKIISVTIIAIGTSLPELVTSVFAAIKGNTDMAIGNIIGSNIFNLLLIIGVSSFIKNIEYNVSYNLDLIILFIATLLLFITPHIGKKEHMTKGGGLTFLVLYVFYMIHLVVG